MKTLSLSMTAAICLSVALAASAQAAVVTVAYSGTASGYDQAGFFGAPGTITDAAFTNVWRFDNSGVIASLTINGFTFEATDEYRNAVSDIVNPGYGRATSLVHREDRRFTDPTNPGWLYYELSNSLVSGATPDAREVGYSATGSIYPTLTGGWNHFSLGGRDYDGRGYYAVGLFLNSTSVTVTTDGAPPRPGLGNFPVVPEPATWATLVLGLGVAGASLRRARFSRTRTPVRANR